MDIIDRLEDDARNIRRFGEERHGFVDYGLMAANAREAAAEIRRLRAVKKRMTAALTQIASDPNGNSEVHMEEARAALIIGHLVGNRESAARER